MNVSFLNMNDECGCLLSFHAHFWYWPLLFHVRESWLPQRGVRRAYHRLFLYKCLSPYICLCLSIVVYLLQDRYGGKYIYKARQTHKYTNIERHGQKYGGRQCLLDICTRTVDGRLSSLPAAAVNSLAHEKGEVKIRSGHEMTTNIHIHHSYSEKTHSSFTLFTFSYGLFFYCL